MRECRVGWITGFKEVEDSVGGGFGNYGRFESKIKWFSFNFLNSREVVNIWY